MRQLYVICKEFRNVPNPEDSSGALGDKHYAILFEELQSDSLQKCEHVQISEAL